LDNFHGFGLAAPLNIALAKLGFVRPTPIQVQADKEGLTTREIADAFYVPEATMAQRISRAKRALQGRQIASTRRRPGGPANDRLV